MLASWELLRYAYKTKSQCPNPKSQLGVPTGHIKTSNIIPSLRGIHCWNLVIGIWDFSGTLINMKNQIAIIDYGAGNLRSVQKALEKLGFDAIITSDQQKIKDATGIILPGVGAFDPAIQELKNKNLIDLIKNELTKGKPFLGLCLGMQLLFDSSEEGKESGLSIIKGLVKLFKPQIPACHTEQIGKAGRPNPKSQHGAPAGHIKIPHMGWNNISVAKTHGIFNGLPASPKMYFVHSYYCEPADKNDILATTQYGSDFCSAVARDNIFALQFHPEKSSDNGLKILKNFGEMCK